MDSSAVQYCRAIREQFTGFHATWPPNAPLRLGDFGRVYGNVFERRSNLVHFEVGWRTRHGRSRSNYAITTGSGTNVRLFARGGVGPAGLALAKALAAVMFDARGALLFNATGCLVDEVEDQVDLGSHILDLFMQRKWDDDWHVVTRIVKAVSTTIAIADEAGASIHLEASSDQDQIDLADATGKLRAAALDRVSSVIVTENDLTPLIGLSRLKRRLFGSRVFGATDWKDEDSFATRERIIANGLSPSEHFRFSDI